MKCPKCGSDKMTVGGWRDRHTDDDRRFEMVAFHFEDTDNTHCIWYAAHLEHVPVDILTHTLTMMPCDCADDSTS